MHDTSTSHKSLELKNDKEYLKLKSISFRPLVISVTGNGSRIKILIGKLYLLKNNLLSTTAWKEKAWFLAIEKRAYHRRRACWPRMEVTLEI